ncbi:MULTISPECIES: DUF1269 domain-containing protein [unclassified Streptomyces]|uniref:DUF1269 domain-containing protein n=1 Tax=unclassified Streptomyces TaxID=2593676 RepID=UPI0022561D18|nr:DUF1269 domain-containing protein [Streptomyces sp. NBC_00340]MCX5133573.1 DUF1269 domain-containing protein [Streptomyces sp. NBC_00340]
MSNLFVVAYDDVATANQVRDKLFELSKQHLVELEDAVVVERHEDGRIKLHQAVSHTAVGAAGGALWGGVIGLLFLAPLLGAAVGAAAGAAGGAITDTGVDDRFMKDVSQNLRPGAAALFVLVKQAAGDKVIPQIAGFGGQLVQTSLSQEQEDALRDAVAAARSHSAGTAPAPQASTSAAPGTATGGTSPSASSGNAGPSRTGAVMSGPGTAATPPKPAPPKPGPPKPTPPAPPTADARSAPVSS